MQKILFFALISLAVALGASVSELYPTQLAVSGIGGNFEVSTSPRFFTIDVNPQKNIFVELTSFENAKKNVNLTVFLTNDLNNLSEAAFYSDAETKGAVAIGPHQYDTNVTGFVIKVQSNTDSVEQFNITATEESGYLYDFNKKIINTRICCGAMKQYLLEVPEDKDESNFHVYVDLFADDVELKAIYMKYEEPVSDECEQEDDDEKESCGWGARDDEIDDDDRRYQLYSTWTLPGKYYIGVMADDESQFMEATYNITISPASSLVAPLLLLVIALAFSLL